MSFFFFFNDNLCLMFFGRWGTSGRGLSCLWRLWWNVSRIRSVCSEVFHPWGGDEEDSSALLISVPFPNTWKLVWQSRRTLFSGDFEVFFKEMSQSLSLIRRAEYRRLTSFTSSTVAPPLPLKWSWLVPAEMRCWSFCRMDASDWRLEILIFIFLFFVFLWLEKSSHSDESSGIFQVQLDVNLAFTWWWLEGGLVRGAEWRQRGVRFFSLDAALLHPDTRLGRPPPSCCRSALVCSDSWFM